MFALSEFFIKGARQSGIHVLLHLTEPETYDIHGSYLFSVAEIHTKSPALVSVIQELLDKADKLYTANKEEHKTAFEAVVRMLNQAILPQHKQGSIHWFIGALKDGQLSFSATGNIRAELFYHKGSSLGSLPLHKPSKRPSESLFQDVNEGRLKTSDILFVASQTTTGHIASDILARMLLTQGAEKSTSIIEQKLQAARTGEAYGGFFVEDIPYEEPVVEDFAEENIEDQPDIEDEKQTSSLRSLVSKIKLKKDPSLSPPKAPLQSSPKKPKLRAESNFRPRQMKREEPLKNVILVMLGRSIFLLFSNILLLIKNIFIGMWRGTILLLLLITNKGNQRETVKNHIAIAINERVHAIRKAPLMSKVLFSLAIITATVFIASLAHLRIKENTRIREQMRINKEQVIEDKLLAVEQSLIFSNKDKARELIEELQTDIASFSIEIEGDEQKKNAYEASLASLELTLRDVRIAEPSLLVDIKAQFSSAEPKAMLLFGDELLAYGGPEDTLYRVNLLTNSVTAHGHASFLSLLGGTHNDDNTQIIFLTEGGDLALFDLNSNTLQTIDLERSQNTTFVDITMYNDRLYTLDAGRGQILRHDKTQTGFTRGDIWLVAPEPALIDGRDITIDGSVYALTKTGGLFKYNRGNQEAFAVKGLDPGLQSPTSLWTSADSRYIYVTEASQNRVVIITKQGVTVGQFISDLWQAPTDSLSYNSKTLVLDDGKIFEFTF